MHGCMDVWFFLSIYLSISYVIFLIFFNVNIYICIHHSCAYIQNITLYTYTHIQSYLYIYLFIYLFASTCAAETKTRQREGGAGQA
jgi:hypothetical protein